LHAGATTIIATSNTKLTAPIVSDEYAAGFSRTYEATPEVTRKVMRAIIRFIPFLSGVSYVDLNYTGEHEGIVRAVDKAEM
jgi:hypothetical protein